MRPPPVSVRALLVLATVAFLPGCGDLDLGPAAELRSEEPVANLHFSRELPHPVAIAARWAPPGVSLDPWLRQWEESWELSAAEGAASRVEALGILVPLVADQVPSAAIHEAFRRVDEALKAAEEALGASLTAWVEGGSSGGSSLEGPLRDALRHFDLALSAREGGDAKQTLLHTLHASDALRATTAGPLAKLFVAQAERELRRISGDETYPDVTRERAARLVAGAREALATGDVALALQRAWYAVGLLRAAESLDRPPPSPDDRSYDR